jgi:hypothetical protein
MKHGIIIACLIGLTAAIGVRAADEPATPPPGHGGGGRPTMNSILSPTVLQQLALTADQKTKYDDLNESFKKDAASLRATSQSTGTSTNGPSGGQSDNRQAFHAMRKSYVDKVRLFLTDEQKTKLDSALEHGPGHGGHGGPNGGAGTPPPPAPSDK